MHSIAHSLFHQFLPNEINRIVENRFLAEKSFDYRKEETRMRKCANRKKETALRYRIQTGIK